MGTRYGLHDHQIGFEESAAARRLVLYLLAEARRIIEVDLIAYP